MSEFSHFAHLFLILLFLCFMVKHSGPNQCQFRLDNKTLEASKKKRLPDLKSGFHMSIYIYCRLLAVFTYFFLFIFFFISFRLTTQRNQV